MKETQRRRGRETWPVRLTKFLEIPIVFEPLGIPGFGWESLQHLRPQGPGKTVQVLGGDPFVIIVISRVGLGLPGLCPTQGSAVVPKSRCRASPVSRSNSHLQACAGVRAGDPPPGGGA